jgi:phosphatidylcholine synthase
LHAVAWLVHLYTASGFVLAFLAAQAAIDHDFRSAFLYLSAQVLVDATDGLLARAARVSEQLPWFSGSKLDDLVDYLTYVFVPALIVWRGLLVVDPWTTIVPSAMLLSSGYGFSHLKAKTSDHFFTGFPSYWNIVVPYLFVLQLSPDVNALILLAFSAMVFVPIRYIYPSRTTILPRTTNVLGAVWAVTAIAILWQYPRVSRPLVLASLAYPVYYFVLSFVVHARTSGRPDSSAEASAKAEGQPRGPEDL